MNIETGDFIGFVWFEGDVEEIFAVQVLRHRFPELMEKDHELLQTVYMVPAEQVRNFEISD